MSGSNGRLMCLGMKTQDLFWSQTVLTAGTHSLQCSIYSSAPTTQIQAFTVQTFCCSAPPSHPDMDSAPQVMSAQVTPSPHDASVCDSVVVGWGCRQSGNCGAYLHKSRIAVNTKCVSAPAHVSDTYKHMRNTHNNSPHRVDFGVCVCGGVFINGEPTQPDVLHMPRVLPELAPASTVSRAKSIMKTFCADF